MAKIRWKVWKLQPFLVGSFTENWFPTFSWKTMSSNLKRSEKSCSEKKLNSWKASKLSCTALQQQQLVLLSRQWLREVGVVADFYCFYPCSQSSPSNRSHLHRHHRECHHRPRCPHQHHHQNCHHPPASAKGSLDTFACYARRGNPHAGNPPLLFISHIAMEISQSHNHNHNLTIKTSHCNGNYHTGNPPLLFISHIVVSIISVRWIFSDCRLWWCTVSKNYIVHILSKHCKKAVPAWRSKFNEQITDYEPQSCLTPMQCNHFPTHPILPCYLPSFNLFREFWSFIDLNIDTSMQCGLVTALSFCICFCVFFSFEEILLGFMLLSALSANS